MVRDKQILLRVEDETREKLKAVASEHNLEVGYLLYRAALRLAYGELNPLDVVGDDRPTVVDMSAITEQLKGLEAEISLLKKRVQFLEARDENVISTQPETVDAVIVEENLGDIPKNSPSRMASDKRNEPIRMKDTRSTNEAATGAKQREYLGNAEFMAVAKEVGVAVTRNQARNWKKTGEFSASGVGKEAAKYFGVEKGKGFYFLEDE